MRVLTGKAAVAFSLATTLALAVYLSFNAWTLPNADRPMSLASLDHRWLATGATVAGLWYLAHIHDDLATKVWLALLTATAFGRALDLLINGSSELPRGTELRAAWAWALIWAGGIVCAFLLNAYSLLWGATGATRSGGGTTDGS